MSEPTTGPDVPVRGAVDVAVVTIAGGRRDHLRRQAASLAVQSTLPDRWVIVDMGGPDPHDVLPTGLADRIEVVVVPIPAEPGRLPLARARNVGVATADADVTILLDVDCIAHPRLVEQYVGLVRRHPGIHSGPVGYLPEDAPDSIDDRLLAGVARHQPGRPNPRTHLHRTDRIELFWSLSFAVDRDAWERIGGFDEGYVGYGGEDTDVGRRAERADVPIWFSGTARAFHQYHPVSSPPVEHVEAICRNAERFHEVWGDWPMEGWLAAFAERGLIDWTPDGDHCRPVAPATSDQVLMDEDVTISPTGPSRSPEDPVAAESSC